MRGDSNSDIIIIIFDPLFNVFYDIAYFLFGFLFWFFLSKCIFFFLNVLYTLPILSNHLIVIAEKIVFDFLIFFSQENATDCVRQCHRFDRKGDRKRIIMWWPNRNRPSTRNTPLLFIFFFLNKFSFLFVLFLFSLICN